MGYIGDTYGRKKALEISIFLMAFPTFAMGCLPSYDRVGILAPILLTLTRLLQGLSVGGQMMSSLVYTVESRPKEKWGLYGSFVMAAANIGTLLGGIIGYWIRKSFSHEALVSYGWRIPFWMGLLVSFSGVYLRLYCEETELNTHLPDGVVPENPIVAGKYYLFAQIVLISTSVFTFLSMHHSNHLLLLDHLSLPIAQSSSPPFRYFSSYAVVGWVLSLLCLDGNLYD